MGGGVCGGEVGRGRGFGVGERDGREVRAGYNW